MSTQVLPSLLGLGFPVTRAPVFATRVQTSISGKEVRIADQVYPRYKWTVDFNFLRANALAEFQSLIGFFNARQGQFDTFLYQDATDNAVTAQVIGTGDGSTQAFQLISTFGGYVQPILAPNTGGTINIYLNGTKQTTGYTVTGWGNASPGVLTFTSAPSSGVAITADFGYYFPCRMSSDEISMSLDYNQIYSCKKFSFISVKN